MTASVVPALIDALISAAESALPDVNVSDGWPLTDDPVRDSLWIGVGGLDVPTFTTAANSLQEWSWTGATQREETGEIVCLAMSWNGDGDVKAARDAVFATADAVATALRANPSLDVSGVAWTSCMTRSAFDQGPTDDGATAVLVFDVSYTARI